MPTDAERIKNHKLFLQGLGGERLVGYVIPFIDYGFSMRKADLSGLNLNNLSLDGKYVTLTNSVFNNCDIKNANELVIGETNEVYGARKSTLNGCKIQGDLIDCELNGNVTCLNPYYFKNCLFNNVNSNISFSGKANSETFVDCIFRNCKIRLIPYSPFLFRRCVFIDCELNKDMGKVYLAECNLTRTKTNCVLQSTKYLEESEFEYEEPDLSRSQLKKITFKNKKTKVDLSQSVLTDVVVDTVNWTGSKLTNAEFINSKIVNSVFDQSECTNLRFNKPLTNCKFRGVTINGEFKDYLKDSRLSGNSTQVTLEKAVFMPGNYSLGVFRGVKFGPNDDLTGSLFINCDLRNAVMPVNLKDSRLDGSNLEGANLGAAKFNRTSCGHVNFKNIGMNSETVIGDSDFSFATFENVDFSVCQINGDNKLNAQFKDCNFDGKNLTTSDMSAELVTLDNCFFNQVIMTNMKMTGKIAGCQFSDAQLSGLDVSSANLSGNTFSSCNLDLANFSNQTIDFSLQSSSLVGAKFDNAKVEVDFLNKPLQNTSWRNADVRGRKFDGSDLSGASFSGALINGATFVGCILSGTDFSNT